MKKSHLNLHHHLTIMDWANFFQEEANKIAAGIVATVLSLLIAFFKKVPHWIGVQTTRLDGIRIVNKGSEINNVLNDLSDFSGAIYIHLVRYHNGDKKKDEPIYWDKMTVDWEEVGQACSKCVAACRNRHEIKHVQREWQKIPITDDWRHKVMDKTRTLKGEIHTVNKEELNSVHQSIFERLDIQCYKEVYIKEKDEKMYTLGLSFCSRFVSYQQAEGMMYLAAKQLRNII